jgi:hypothetical protein
MRHKERKDSIQILKNLVCLSSDDLSEYENKRRFINKHVSKEILDKIRLEEKEESKKQVKLRKFMDIIKIEADIHGVPIVVYNPTTKQIEHKYADGTIKVYKQL